MELCGFEAGNDRPLFLVAGTCVIENEAVTLETAGALAGMAARIGIPLIYKASFDKANRSSAASFRGPGMEQGLAALERVRGELGLPVLTDVHEDTPLDEVAAVVDVLQTPAFLCRQTNFIQRVAAAGRPVNIKKGQFLAPWDMDHVVAKARAAGNEQIMVCERGVSFGYNNLVSDMRALAVMRPAARWSSTPPTRCSCRAGRATPRAGSASSSRCWRARRSRRGSRACSWRPTRAPKRPCRTAPTPGRSIAWKSC